MWTGKQMLSMVIPPVCLNTDVQLDGSLSPEDKVVIVDRVWAAALCMLRSSRVRSVWCGVVWCGVVGVVGVRWVW